MSEQNKGVVEQAYNNFKSGNIEALLDLFADDITWRLPEMEGIPFGGVRTGRASVADFFATVGATQESIRFEPGEMIAEGDRVVVLGSYEWKVIPTGRNFSGRWVHVWTIRNGKATDFDEYTDTAAAVAGHRKAMSA